MYTCTCKQTKNGVIFNDYGCYFFVAVGKTIIKSIMELKNHAEATVMGLCLVLVCQHAWFRISLCNNFTTAESLFMYSVNRL